MTLAAPAAADAATYTVAAGGGACGAGDLTCESLAVAAGAVAAGDTVSVMRGTYAEPSNFAVPVTISGAAAGVVVTGTITFSGAGASPSVLEKVIVVTSAGPAVSVTGPAGVAVRDSALVSAAEHGMSIAGGAGNSITRSSVYSAAAGTAAVLVQPGATATGLVLESSVLSGGSGAEGAGLRVRTGVNSLPGGAGGATVTARHITVAGTAKGIVLAAPAAAGLPLAPAVGSIAATISDSIVLGASSTANYPGLLTALPITTIPANAATLTFSAVNDRTSTPEALFANPAKRNYHLRAGSPAIDKAAGPGESPTDVDGQARTNGVASDLGADEFYVGPPPPAPPTAATSRSDGTPPAIVIAKPKANQKIKLSTTRKRTVTVDGRKVTRRTTTRLKRLAVSGTAKDPSGVRGVVLTIEKLGGTATKCKWFNPKKGIVLRSCKKPPLLLAKLAANGTWTYSVDARKLSAGAYRVIVVGADNSGAFGNSALRGDAIRRFTLTKK
ncbi:MAG TPA: choice-of-anchor Q domain-containing protein [Solirubrobacteraceae bacterium]|nr:choice-of-anchor Q domain-containing protein [Solirubrobacteraceae bacterium]